MNADLTRILAIIVEHLDVPKSLYEKAAARHRSLGEWLHRDGSKVAHLDPDVRPQGSFRFGTVNRPLNERDEYDLDNVCLLKLLRKSTLTQEQLKQLYGEEIREYAKANGIIAPVTEHNRCWRLQYADEVAFHLDTLPCVPEDEIVIRRIMECGVPVELARRAVAISDRRHPQYREITSLWPSSNPRGFAVYFEQRAALGRQRPTANGQVRAAIEDVPPYEWKTTLQRSIQILKRHRDVMFRKNPELAPISMIITNLAAQAYNGEADLAAAIHNIVERMPEFVRPVAPRIPNPADTAEDYADKWRFDARLEKSFWDWHTAIKADLARLPTLLERDTLKTDIRSLFAIDLTDQQVRQFSRPTSARVITPAASPIFTFPAAQKPWGRNG